MASPIVRVIVLLATACLGCSSNAVGGGGAPVDAGSDAAASTCVSAADCDDGDACTTDVCSGVCAHATTPSCTTACDTAHPCVTGHCDPASFTCVACLTDANCPPGAACMAHACVSAPSCATDLDCKAIDGVCALPAGVCVDCLSNADCAADQRCEERHCVARPPCASSKDCAKVCDKTLAICVDCAADSDCGAGAFCDELQRCRAAVCLGGTCAQGAYFACKPGGSRYLAGTACDDGDDCTQDACTATGCSHTTTSGACDDDNACTSGDVCGPAGCAGAKLDCDDDNVCTTDTCAPLAGCQHGANGFGCDDGDVCTANDVCKGTTCSGAPIACDDDDPCTADACASGQGCVHDKATGSACDDGDACSSDDVCAGGKCTGTTVSCDDGNVCTADACNAKSGCAVVPAAGVCDDGDVCTGPDACADGSCVGVVVSCDDGVACTTDACSANVGCSNKASDAACDDAESCTDDSCDAAAGCANTPITAPCDDGDTCTTVDLCQAGACVGGAAPDCDDGNVCTDDACAVKTGCVNANNKVACDDGQACTIDDACALGACVGKDKLFMTSLSTVYKNFLVGLTDGFAVASAAGPKQVSLTKRDFTGKILWQKTYSVAQSGAVRLIATATGFGIGSGTFGGALIAVDNDGAKKWELTMPGTASSTIGSGGVVESSDDLVWLGVNSGGNGIHIVRANTAGAVVSDVVILGGGVAISKALEVEDGILICGRASAGWIRLIDLKSKSLWYKSYPNAIDDMVLIKGGLLFAGEAGGEKNAPYSWIARGSLTGDLVWSQTLSTPYSGVNAIVALPDGLAAAGWVNNLVPDANDGDDYWLVRADANGTVLWTRGYSAKGLQRTGALLALPDGFALAGPDSTSNGGILIRTDAFGNTSCTESGGCLAKTTASCDDANACTLDLCTAKTGCTHTNVANATKCGDGKTCSDGVCGP